MIKPEEIPQYTGNLELLEKACSGLKKDAGHIRSVGADVHTHFQGLSAYYKAPEAEQLFATTKPVKERAHDFAEDLGTVSTALSEYATEIRPLVTKLKSLKSKATTFVNDHKDDDDWQYDEDKVDEHNELRDEITRTVAAFWAAERTCHNKITALFNGDQMVAGDGSDRKNQYGFNADDMEKAKLPWGDPVEEKHHAWEIGHWVKSFVWDGLIVDGVWGTLKGLGTLVGFGGWDAMGQAWKGLAQLATGLAITSIPGAGTLFWALPDDKLPSWLRDSRTAMKETGKALVAWDEWGKNPGRAAGAVTFNVVTTVFTGGAGGAASGAGKAGAVAKTLAAAGKAGRVIDPMTYITKGAGAGLSKIGDIAKGLKGIESIDIPKLPDGTVHIPEGSYLTPDGKVHLPDGSGTPIPDDAVKIPKDSVALPDGGLLPPGSVKLPGEGAPRFMDTDGNIYKSDGSLAHDAAHAPTDIVDRPAAGSDVPRVDSPTRQPDLVAAGARPLDNATHVNLGSGLDDLGRTGDDIPGGHADDNLPGGRAGDNLPGGHAGDNLPGGHAHDHGPGPSASHEPPSGGHPHDGHNLGHDDVGHGRHGDDASHGGHDVAPAGHGEGPAGGHDGSHGDGGSGADGPNHPEGDGPSEPQGKHMDPQPPWHGESAGKMRHYRRPALDVSHLSPDAQLGALERESAALADEARKPEPVPGAEQPKGSATAAEPPGENLLASGCAGSFLHDNVITVHTSTTKMHGQKVPNTHHVLEGVLKDVGEMLDALKAEKGKAYGRGQGHGKCAEISLISDRLHQLDPTGTSIRTVDDAKQALEGSAMHTRQIGDVHDAEGNLVRSHGDYLKPCRTCEHVLPRLGIRPHS
ncbi:YwqJ-related putative deaminase [Streptomyces cucumeris]|uniref:YwqJ-related putative deaminase n=1 Tax=Streptomyces cucumeris TaxID=2962890 RepID=UPI003D7127B4